MSYLHTRIFGNNDYRHIRHVLIDEAQDYYPLQYEILRLLFPHAQYTILGDIDQTLAKQENASFYEQVQQILVKKSSLVTLDKSFRCTEEILQFALQFVKHKPAVQHFNRQGKTVTVLTFANCEDYLKQIIGEVKNCQEAGLSTICLLCKTQENGERLFAELQYRLTIRLFKDDKTETLSGNLLMPSYQAKGLEFDAVLICDAETRYYHTEDDGKILYVQCTRALHKLSLLAYGELTPFIDPRYCHKIKL